MVDDYMLKPPSKVSSEGYNDLRIRLLNNMNAYYSSSVDSIDRGKTSMEEQHMMNLYGVRSAI